MFRPMSAKWPNVAKYELWSGGRTPVQKLGLGWVPRYTTSILKALISFGWLGPFRFRVSMDP